ncbi:hypothetical protein ACIP79_19675 [Streptomyces sp. NPDC088747]|uniref:hypothetical protein n=1 Tax=Streptomyces sp. NPDC088747 TaxID=3365886 RepID=UPI003813C15F
MSAAVPAAKPSVHDGGIVPRAWAEALSMTCADPVHAHDRRPCGELAAAALRAHSVLSAGFGQHIAFTGLGPDGGGVRALAAFLAVYAARHERQDTYSLQSAGAV